MPRLKEIFCKVSEIQSLENPRWMLFESQPAVLRVNTPVLKLVKIELLQDQDYTWPPTMRSFRANIAAAFEQGPKVHCYRARVSEIVPW
jgi:hypothetical protein